MSSVVPPDATPYVQGFPSFSTRIIYGQWIFTDGTGVSVLPLINYVGTPYFLSVPQVTMFAKQQNVALASAVGDSTVGVWWAEVLVHDDPDVVGDVQIRISHDLLPGGGVTIEIPAGEGPYNVGPAIQAALL